MGSLYSVIWGMGQVITSYAPAHVQRSAVTTSLLFSLDYNPLCPLIAQLFLSRIASFEGKRATSHSRRKIKTCCYAKSSRHKHAKYLCSNFRDIHRFQPQNPSTKMQFVL